MERLLFRPTELIEMLGLSRSTIYKLIETRELASIQIGRSRRVTVAALNEWIERNKS